MTQEEIDNVIGYSSIISIVDKNDYNFQELILPKIVQNDHKKVEFALILKINTNRFFDFYDLVREIQNNHNNILFIAPQRLDVYPRTANTINNENITLENCVFESTLKIVDIPGIDSLTIWNCIFKDQLLLRNQELNGFDSFSTFYKILKIYDCKLLNSFSIRFTELHVFDFDSSKIPDNINFYGCTFSEEPYFKSLNYAALNGDITFSKTEFLNGIIINKIGLDLDNLKFQRSKFSISKGITNYPSHISQIRLSANKLKKELRKTDNIIDANQFAKLELEAFRLDPFNDVSWWDKRILWWNYWSNQHGTSPGYALGFIGLATLVFSLLLCIPIAGQLQWDVAKGIGPTVNHFFEVLMITNWKFKPYGIESYWTLPILFIGRVFIGYGIYQFIAAFRKYAKN